MTLREARCPSCGASIGRGAFGELASDCSYCGAAFLPAGEPTGRKSIVIARVGENRIEIIKCVRAFSGLGLAEVMRALDRLPATFSFNAPNILPAQAIRELAALGCVGSIVTEAAQLPSDPVFAGYEGTWGFRIESAGTAKIEAIKLVRELGDLGLAEAKAAVETPRAFVPIATRATHEEIRRRFAALGYTISFSPWGG